MRRKPKENNFKAVLETIRHLMNTECVVPEWIHDIILGYGDPSAARYDKYVETAIFYSFQMHFFTCSCKSYFSNS